MDGKAEAEAGTERAKHRLPVHHCYKALSGECLATRKTCGPHPVDLVEVEADAPTARVVEAVVIPVYIISSLFVTAYYSNYKHC